MFHNVISICVLMIATFLSLAKIYLPNTSLYIEQIPTLLLMWHLSLK